jgi:hypothetical protein
MHKINFKSTSMTTVRYALFALMLLTLNVSNLWAIPPTPIIIKQQSIDSDTLGVDQFWQLLKQHCGKAYEGTVTSGATANDVFSGKRLVMHVLSCSENQLLIPFNVGENRSRTWILTKVKDRIELKHDHRHEDGTKDAVTMYGGTTTNSGLPGIAVFPADQLTVTTIPTAANNVWWITINTKTFTYNLRRIGSDRLITVTFDITKPVEKPLPSWGWDNFKQ